MNGTSTAQGRNVYRPNIWLQKRGADRIQRNRLQSASVSRGTESTIVEEDRTPTVRNEPETNPKFVITTMKPTKTKGQNKKLSDGTLAAFARPKREGENKFVITTRRIKQVSSESSSSDEDELERDIPVKVFFYNNGKFY